MSKEVFLIYQDCPYCHPREKWGEEQSRVASEYHIKVLPTHFSTPGAKGLIEKAANRGVSTLPFFTDGVSFSYNLIDFVNQDTRPSSEKRSRKKAKAEEEADGDIS